MEHLITANTKIIYVRGLAFDMTEKDIRYIFRDCGTITNLKMLYADNGRFKGSGYVVFETHEMALNAVKLDDTTYKNKFVYVSLNSSSRIEDLFKHYAENPEPEENETQEINNISQTKRTKFIPTSRILLDDEISSDSHSSSPYGRIRIPPAMLSSIRNQQSRNQDDEKSSKHDHKHHHEHHRHHHEHEPRHRHRRVRDKSHISHLDSSSDELYHTDFPK